MPGYQHVNYLKGMKQPVLKRTPLSKHWCNTVTLDTQVPYKYQHPEQLDSLMRANMNELAESLKLFLKVTWVLNPEVAYF